MITTNVFYFDDPVDILVGGGGGCDTADVLFLVGGGGCDTDDVLFLVGGGGL